MLSTRQEIANPRFFRQEEHSLTKVQRRQSKAEKDTPDRAERRKVVTRFLERIAWRRGDFTHQQRRRIVNAFAVRAFWHWGNIVCLRASSSRRCPGEVSPPCVIPVY